MNLQEYGNHLDTLQERNSCSKTDKDATFGEMKEDAMSNGRTKPGYNLQIGTENRFITDFALFPNPTNTLTIMPFLQSSPNGYGRAHTVVAGSCHGSKKITASCRKTVWKPTSNTNTTTPTCICPMGQRTQGIETRHLKTASGYVSEKCQVQSRQM